MRAPSRPIVLVGLMGCGKTTVGSALADRLDRPFWDGDARLLEVTGMTAAVLGAERGLDVLHGLELEVMSLGLAHRPPSVVAAAAAVSLDPRLPGLLLDAWTVWLHPDRFEIRTGAQRATATLSGEAATLSLLLYRRLSLQSADVTVEGRHDLVELWIENSALE